MGNGFGVQLRAAVENIETTSPGQNIFQDVWSKENRNWKGSRWITITAMEADGSPHLHALEHAIERSLPWFKEQSFILPTNIYIFQIGILYIKVLWNFICPWNLSWHAVRPSDLKIHCSQTCVPLTWPTRIWKHTFPSFLAFSKYLLRVPWFNSVSKFVFLVYTTSLMRSWICLFSGWHQLRGFHWLELWERVQKLRPSVKLQPQSVAVQERSTPMGTKWCFEFLLYGIFMYYIYTCS